MKSANLLCIVLILIVFSCKQEDEPTAFPIMGNLEVGLHQVGFKTLFHYDKTKTGIPYSDWDGKLTHNQETEKGRQYQINVWYPAKKGTGTAIQYEHYVHLMGRQTNFGISPAQDAFARQTFIDQTNALGGNGRFTARSLDTLSSLEVGARLEAKLASGTFPVVVFPNGSSPAFQSITAEFLAGHGYVVVGFAPKGRFSSGTETSAIGLETAVDDLEFVLGIVSELPHTDMDRMAVLANAISSSVGAALVSRNSKIKALISLEGGLPSAFEQRLLKQTVFYQPENIHIPILFIYAPHPSIDPKYVTDLQYADRYFAHFPNMSEFAMLNYGMFDAFIPDIIGKHGQKTQKGYEVANELVLEFLNGCLKEGALDLFGTDREERFASVVDTTFVLPALECPPNMAVLKDLFYRQGFGAVDSIYQVLKAGGNPQPFSISFYTDYRIWLSWKKDPDHRHRLRLYQLAYDSYPERASVNYYLAYYLQQSGDKDRAAYHFERARELLKTDVEMNPSERERIRQNIERALTNL